jgi:hypothetical protein
MRSSKRARIALLFALAAHVPAAAADGVLEINHACATATGCFAGDDPGYPVVVAQPGSYRLTGNLNVPAGSNGLELGNGVDLDLAGFEIAGPISCLSGCPPVGTGSGIVGTLFGGNQCAVSNGKVRGFAEDGVRLGLQAEVRRLRVTDIARHGISLSGGSFAAWNLINRIGQNGMRFTVSSLVAASLYERNTIANTGQQSVVEGKPSGPNVCSDLLCGTSGRKLVYATTTQFNGANADTACAPGFHMAALYEIFDSSEWEYDTARGLVNTDSGQAWPTGFPGWIRTGYLARSLAIDPPGNANCNGWSVSAASSFGTVAYPSADWDTGAPVSPVHPWITSTSDCSQLRTVWCAQD